MALTDNAKKLKIRPLFNPGIAVTNNTAFVSNIIDTAGYGSLVLAVHTGSIADADVTFTVLLEESNDSAMGSQNAVADADLIGTEAGCAPLFSNDNTVCKLGYIGSKRYVRMTITPANNTGDIYLSGVAIQGHSQTFDQNDQKVT